MDGARLFAEVGQLVFNIMFCAEISALRPQSNKNKYEFNNLRIHITKGTYCELSDSFIFKQRGHCHGALRTALHRFLSQRYI